MSLVLKDRVKETTDTTGTGAVTLLGAEKGFQPFSIVGDGNQTYYAIENSTTGDWETGVGTYSASGPTLSRDEVIDSSNSGSLVSFADGNKAVFCTYPAEKSIHEKNLFAVDETVTVGSTGDFATINDALEYYSTKYPNYRAEGILVEIVLLNSFVMEEQVLVNDVDLGWIRITNEAAGERSVTAITEGTTPLVTGVAQVADVDIDTFLNDATDLNGARVELTTGNGTEHYFWFNAETNQEAEVSFNVFDVSDLDGEYLQLDLPNGTQQFFWFDSTGSGTPPAEGEGTDIQIDTSGATTATLAGIVATAINDTTGYGATEASDIITITADNVGFANWFSSDSEGFISFIITQTGGATDPNLSGTGHEIAILVADTEADVATKLQTVITGVTGFTASVTDTVVTVTNDDTGEAEASATGAVTLTVTTEGVTEANQVQITTDSAHGYSDGDTVAIRFHVGTVEEVDYNGVYVVDNADTTTFELSGVFFDASRAGSGDTGITVRINPTIVSRENLTQEWELFYYPAFGVARGVLPRISCVFEMDESGDPATIAGAEYQSYLDGLCATDQGIINVDPFAGFINAHGTNCYGTRVSQINANDGIFNRGGRHGVWAYSSSIINARRCTANECGWVAKALDKPRIDDIDEISGAGIIATRSSIINADECRASGNYADNIHSEHGALISAPIVEAFDSEIGEDIGLRYGGMVSQSGDLGDGLRTNFTYTEGAEIDTTKGNRIFGLKAAALEIDFDVFEFEGSAEFVGDLTVNDILVLAPRTTLPPSPEVGTIVMHDDSGALAPKFWDGSTWRSLV